MIGPMNHLGLRRRVPTLLLALALVTSPAIGVGAQSPASASYERPLVPSTQSYLVDVAPGVQLAGYEERIDARVVRYYVLSADWQAPGIGFQLLQPPTRDQVQSVPAQAVVVPGLVAAANADFFDIGRTGAPLGLGVRDSAVQHGRTGVANPTFFVDAAGVPQVGNLSLTLPVRRRPGFGLTSYNAPWVPRGGIGVYDASWGRSAGFTWTQGQRRRVLMARVVNNRVVKFRRSFPAGQPIVGEYLVARGAGAVARLRRLNVGNRFHYSRAVPGAPRMAVTGSQIVLTGGQVAATDDVVLHPRTAVCVDPASHRVHLLVVEGRQETSVGYTLVEVAQRLQSLGCTVGLNLDGGGSTTLVARQNGTLGLVNSPAGGHLRNVANALGVTSTQ